MTTIMAFIKRHPVLTYFALTFALSWGGILIGAGSGGISATSEPSEMQLPFVYLAMLVGPSVAGILLTGLVDGRAGFRALLSRLFRWRVGARWYAIALLTAPLVWMATLFALSLSSPAFVPDIVASDDKASLLLMGIAVDRVSRQQGNPAAVRQAQIVFGVQLALNALWSVLFFGLRSPLAAHTTSPAGSISTSVGQEFAPYRRQIVICASLITGPIVVEGSAGRELHGQRDV